MKTTVRYLVLVAVLTAVTHSSPAATKTWQGNAGSVHWSDPGNWDPAGVPQDGDALVFPASGAASLSQNDLTNIRLHSITLHGGGYELTGNAVRLDSALTDTHSGAVPNQVAFRILFTGAGSVNVIGSHSGTLLEIREQLRLSSDLPLTLFVDAADNQGAAGDLTLYDAIVSPGDVVKLGRGELTFRSGNPNVYDGTLFVLEGTAHLLGNRPLSTERGSGRMVIGSNGVSQATVFVGPTAWAGQTFIEVNDSHLVFNHDTGVTFLNLSEGARVDGPGSLTLYGGIESTANARTPIIDLPLNIFPAFTSFIIRGASYSGLDLRTPIGGPGGLGKSGNAALVLSRSNSFAGNVNVAEGILDVAHADALGNGTNVAVFTSGALLLRGVSVSGKQLDVLTAWPVGAGLFATVLTIAGASTWSGAVSLRTNLIILGSDLTFTGPISGGGGIVPLNETLTLAGPEPNTFTGALQARGRLLQLGKPAGVAAFGGPLVVGAGEGLVNEVRWLQDYQRVFADVTVLSHGFVNLNGHRDDFGPVTFNGGSISTGAAGELGLYGLLTVSAPDDVATIEGRLGLPPGLHEFRVNDGGAFPDLNLNATLLGAGHLRKTVTGQMWLATANTYEGLTTVAEGALSVLDPNGLGGATTGTIVQEGATLELNFNGTTPEPLALRGTGISGQGALGVFGNVTLRHQFPSLFAPIDLTTNSTIGVGSAAMLTVDGFITGVGHLTKVGPGTLTFTGSDHNTYAGETFINEGAFIMSKPSGVTAVPGALSIGSATGLSAVAGHTASYQVLGNIFINRNGLLNLNGQAENVDHLWLTEGGDVQTTTGVLFLKTDGSIQVVPGAVGDLSTITGNLDMDAGDHVINVGAGTGSGLSSAVQLEISALMTSTLGAVNLQKNGPGLLRLEADNTYSGSTVVNAGVLLVDGNQPGSSVSVQNGGQLAGQGRTGSINFLSSGSGSRVLAPGQAPGPSPGILTCSAFNSAGTGGILRVDLNGTTPGSNGHDQLHAVGRFTTVRLDGVTLDATLNFASSVNDQFIIILNDGIRTSVLGEFTGLPEGANCYIGGEQFTITYAGGDGNDVVLSRIPTPTRPTLTIEPLPPASVRLLWPTSSPPFRLESNTNLLTTNWAAVSQSPVAVGANLVVTNTAGEAREFYRLTSP